MSSDLLIQCLTDKDGEKTAVVIPIGAWNEYADFLAEYFSLKHSIQRGLQEAQQTIATGNSTQAAKDFLDEL